MPENTHPNDIPVATPVSVNHPPPDAVHVPATATSDFSAFHQQLQDGFAQDFIEQGKRLDETAKQLLTLQLALPGLFAALLKLLEGKDATLDSTEFFGVVLIAGAFFSWMAAVFFSLRALKPEQHRVNPQVLENRSTQKDFFGLLDFYQYSAARKHQNISVSSVLTILGLVLMITNLLMF